MSETATHVVVAANGIDHNGRHYPAGTQVRLDAQSASYHLRNHTVAPLAKEKPKTTKSTRENTI